MSGLNKGLIGGLAVLAVAGAAFMMLSKKEAELRLQKELSRDKDVNLSRLITRPD